MTTAEIFQVNESRAIPETLRIIGAAIQNAQTYLPLRNHAAALATLADPHDYLSQLEAIYQDFLDHWRYVRDPVSAETMVVSGPEIMRYLFGYENGVGRGLGAGDCDDAAIALGAAAASIGFPVRLGTSSDGGPWSHVFIQAHCPGCGWVTLDPVLHPFQQFGAIVKAPRIGFWNLDGRPVSLSGIDPTVYGPGLPVPFAIELQPGERAPAIGLMPSDFDYVAKYGRGYAGMMGIGSNGVVYELETGYGSGLGYRPGDLFRAIGRGIKRVVTGVWGVVEGIFQATKLGRWLLGGIQKAVSWIVDNIPAIAKVVGWLGPSVAPLLAVIPGIGPYLAAVGVMSGAAAGVVLKWGIPILKTVKQIITGEEIEFSVLQFDSEEMEQVFSDELTAALSEFEGLSDNELKTVLADLEETVDDFDVKNPFTLTPKQSYLQAGVSSPEAAAQIAITQELTARKTAEARARFAAAANKARLEQAAIERRRQSAEAAAKWKREHAPEVLRAAETAQAAAQARAIVTGKAAEAARYAAQATPAAQAAQYAEIKTLAKTSPEARAEMTAETIADLELLGFAAMEG